MPRFLEHFGQASLMPEIHDLRFLSPKSRPNLDPNSLRGSNPKMPACVGMLCLTSPISGLSCDAW